MKGVLRFLGLFRRGTTLLAAVPVVGLGAMLASEGEPNLFLLFVASALGFFVGQMVRELQYHRMSWTLPGFRRSTLLAVGGMGLLGSLLMTWLYGQAGGGASIARAFGLALFAFGLGFGAPRLAALFLVTALFEDTALERWLDTQVGQGNLLILLGAVGVSLVLALRVFQTSVARRAPERLPLPIWGGLRRERAWKKEGALRGSGTDWPLVRTGPRLLDWVRAAVHESHGFHRPVWLRSIWIAPACMSGVMIVRALESRSLSLGDPGWASRILPMFDGTPRSVGITGVGIAVSIMSAALIAPTALRLAPRYPLSRPQLARVTYWASLLESVVLSVSALVFFSLAGALILAFVDRPESFQLTPGLLLPAAVGFLVLPFIQWVRLSFKCGNDPGRARNVVLYQASILLGLAAVPLLTVAWVSYFPGSLLPGILGCLALAIPVQALYQWRLRRHFLSIDLR